MWTVYNKYIIITNIDEAIIKENLFNAFQISNIKKVIKK